MKPTFIIEDWAGNICFNGKTFEGFEEAWGFIYETVPEEFEGDGTYDDYFVVEAPTRGAQ